MYREIINDIKAKQAEFIGRNIALSQEYYRALGANDAKALIAATEGLRQLNNEVQLFEKQVQLISTIAAF